MPAFGERSKKKLATVHPDLQKVLNEAIEHFDFTIVYGSRTVEEQLELFKVGRKIVNGQWVVVGKTVTKLDGINKKSKHNYKPSKAVDIAPWTGTIDWGNLSAFKEMADVMKAAAKTVGVEIVWGGDWENFRDYPHFELKEDA